MIKMSKSIIHRETCRSCNGNDLVIVLPLAPTPIADAYVSDKTLHQEIYPLDVFLCKSCGLVQLLDIIDPAILYRNFLYETSTSLGLDKHFQKYADEVFEYVNPPKDSLIIDIGSNDGTLLRFFKSKGMKVLGIDPAREIAMKTTKSGIETLPEFFTIPLAKKIKSRYGTAAIVTSNNTIANIDDINGLIQAIREILSPEGVFVFETIYSVDLFKENTFDNIYHEHISYFSIKPFEVLFSNNDLELIEVKRIPTKGGSIRCVVQHKNGPREKSGSIVNLLELEEKLGIHDEKTLKDLNDKLEMVKNKIKIKLIDLKKQEKTIAGYCASPSVTTLIYHFDIGKLLSYIVDDNTIKQNTYSPGLHIPVIPPEEIYNQNPDYIVILAPRYFEPIIKKHQKYLDNGGKFIVPLPVPEIIDNEGNEQI